MKNLKSVLLYGLAVWAIPFIGGMFIFPLWQNDRPLFESLITVIAVLSAVILGVNYISKQKSFSASTGVKIGFLWLGISIFIDLFFFVFGPLKMTLVNYLKDIAVSYLSLPIIIAGLGYVRSKRG